MGIHGAGNDGLEGVVCCLGCNSEEVGAVYHATWEATCLDLVQQEAMTVGWWQLYGTVEQLEPGYRLLGISGDPLEQNNRPLGASKGDYAWCVVCCKGRV